MTRIALVCYHSFVFLFVILQLWHNLILSDDVFQQIMTVADLVIAGVQAPDREVYLSLKHGVEAKSYDEVCIRDSLFSFDFVLSFL